VHSNRHRTTFRGTISCATSADYHIVGYVSQQQGSEQATGLLELFGTCSRYPTQWSAVSTSVERTWRPWKTASVRGNGEACSPYMCSGAAFGPTLVKLRVR
jgi:hypothetical protein